MLQQAVHIFQDDELLLDDGSIVKVPRWVLERTTKPSVQDAARDWAQRIGLIQRTESSPRLVPGR